MNTLTAEKWGAWRQELVRTASAQEHEWIDEDEMPQLLAQASLKGISVQTMLACRDLFLEEEKFQYAVRRAANQGKARILLVDPDEQQRKLCEKILKSTGLYDVSGLSEAREALDRARVWAPSLLITEMALNGTVNGMGLKYHLETVLGRKMPTLVLERVLDETGYDAVAALGVLHLSKPVVSRALLHCTETLLALAK